MRYTPSSTFSDSIFYLFDVAFQWSSRLINSTPTSFIDVETVEDANTLVMSDGTLVSAVMLNGVSKAVLEEEFSDILDTAERKLMAYMSDGCHYTSFYFLRDSDGIGEELEKSYGIVRHSSKAMGLELTDIIDEQVGVLKEHCQKERAILLLWTNTKGLSNVERHILGKERIKERTGMPLANDAQNIGMGAGGMLSRHLSFISEFCRDLSEVNLSTTLMSSHEFLREIRMSIDSEWTSDDWEPSLPGDPMPMKLNNPGSTDASGMLWPQLNSQLCPRGAEHIDHETVRIGGMVFAPISIEIMPKSPEPFQSLFKRLNGEKVPWRMHSLIRNDGLEVLGFKELLASYMRFTPGAPENKYLVDVKEQLVKLRDGGDEIVKLQITLCTWAPVGDADLLRKRKAILARCVQGWGACDVAPAEGDSLETMMCSTPGAVMGSIANASAAPLYDALKMSPLTRPASPWVTGSQPFRTADGKLMPYQPYSKLQTAWTTLIFGPMGYGKSLFMNYCNLSLVLSPDNVELPYISILDVGPSSRGLISLLRSALPKAERHQVMYERLLNTREYAINVFDTKLGLRRPLANQKSFLANFLAYLAMPDDKDLPPDGVMGIADSLIDLAYNECADRKSARVYQQRVIPLVDIILQEQGFEFHANKTKWWDVVDFLYSKGYSREATLAQRYAVPNLSTMNYLVRDERIQSVYGEVKVSATNEPLVTFFWRKLTEAINKYPVISEETKFDLGEARIVSLDLDEVAKGQGVDSKRRTGLMYMVAYYVLTNRFFTGKEHLSEMPGEVGIYKVDYREYHRKSIESIRKSPKRFCIDEKQRVKGLSVVENQLDESIREGRKWKVEIMQASQLPDDFSSDSVRLATNVFILGGGSKSNCRIAAKTFDLSETMVQHLNESLRKPNKNGATFLSLVETDKGSFEQLLMSTQGPTFLWVCNSSSDDSFVRNELADKIGEFEARTLLVKEFPSGNLDDEIERRKHKLGSQDEALSSRDVEKEDTPKGILSDIIDDLLIKHQSMLDRHMGAA